MSGLYAPRKHSANRENGRAARHAGRLVQAQESGTDIITVTNAILAKLPNFGKDLKQLSLETVQMFVNDGKSLGFSIRA